MNLLEDLQNMTVDASSDLGTLLRKCTILAARLGSKQLEDWLTWEANGYPKNVPVPKYRVWSLQVKGDFVGLHQSISNQTIPPALLPEDVRKSYNNYEFRENIANVEYYLEENKTGIIYVSTQDLALTLGTKVFKQMNCLECWAEFSMSNFVELLNSVRNRLLEFLVTVQKEHSNVDKIDSNPLDSPNSGKITQIFYTTVYGGSANFVGTSNDSSLAFNIGLNDFESVRCVLQENGVSEKDIIELKNALVDDKPSQTTGSFGPKVSSWITSMMQKAADGTWNIGTGAAANLLSNLLSGS